MWMVPVWVCIFLENSVRQTRLLWYWIKILPRAVVSGYISPIVRNNRVYS